MPSLGIKASSRKTTVSGYPAMVLATTGLVSYWKLDEAAVSTGSTAFDAKATNNGTYNNSTGDGVGLIVASGNTPRGISKPWAGNLEVTLTSSSSLNQVNAISIEMWFNATTLTSGRRFFQKGATDNQYRLLFDISDMLFSIDGVNSLHFPAPSTGATHHIVATYDRLFIRAYIDGASVGTPVSATGAIATTTDNAAIGNKPGSGSSGDHFNGVLDEVSLYSVALTADQIAAHWHAGSGT